MKFLQVGSTTPPGKIVPCHTDLLSLIFRSFKATRKGTGTINRQMSNIALLNILKRFVASLEWGA